jgi:2'-5' RNA ligase
VAVQSVELLVDDDLDACLRGQWQLLGAAGLPSQEHNRAPSNRPHVTVGVATEIYPRIDRKLTTLAARLPMACTLSGPAVFSHRTDILVRLVEPSAELLDLQAEVAARLRECPGRPDNLAPGAWTPHVTLARRLHRAQTAEALELLDWTPRQGEFTGLRRWDGRAHRDWRLG